MNNKLIMSIIGIAIGVILVGSVLAPVIADTADKTVVYNNFGDRATLVEDASDMDEVTIRLTYATPSITVNGESFSPAEDRVTPWYLIFSSDELSVYYQWANSNATISLIVYSETQSAGLISVLTNDLTITVSDGVIEYSYATFNLNRHCTWCSYLDKDGDHVNLMTYTGIPTTTAYFTSIEDIRGCSIGYNQTKIYSYIGLDVEVNKLRGVALGGELTATCEYGDYSGNANIKTIEIGRASGTYTITDGSVVTHPYSYVLPYEVSAFQPGMSPSVSSMLQILPLLIIVALVTSAVGIIYTSRR